MAKKKAAVVPATTATKAQKYAAHKNKMAKIGRLLAMSGRDIAPLPDPEIENTTRRERCRRDFKTFCEAYFPLTFSRKWSADHLKAIVKIQTAILEGGLFALAMPRGSGKTSLVETACIWAILYGHAQFVALIGASAEAATEMLSSIKSELENNDILYSDFKRILYPIHKLEGIANRCNGQLFNNQRTHITWTSSEIVLPTMPGPNNEGSGAILKVAGITGRIRGMKFKRSDGQAVRPTLVVIDDPQTDDSARSASQNAKRESILAGAVLGLAGPGKKIAGVMPCTIIQPGDMADNILDRMKHPEWNGERTKMVYKFPSNSKLWDDYRTLRAESFKQHGHGRGATTFYETNRSAMDDGAEVAWEERFDPDELSAIQHAMNKKFDLGDAAFSAEYQNEPIVTDLGDEDNLSADRIASKLNGHQRGVVPIDANHLTMFVDVQGKMLFWMVCGWGDNFTGYVLDYGVFPDQKLNYFTLRDSKRTLQSVFKGTGTEGAIYAGLQELCKEQLDREWRRDDGAAMRIGLCLIDANWGNSTDVIYQFCRQDSHSALLLPSHGRGVGAASKPFSEYRPEPGCRTGLNWRIPITLGKRAIRHVIHDVNFWKSFVHARLMVPMGDKGCLSLFGREPVTHRMLADHLTAEYKIRTEGRGRTVDEWRIRADSRDNHWFDALVGCAAAASIQGCKLEIAGSGVITQKRGKRYTIEQLTAAYRR